MAKKNISPLRVVLIIAAVLAAVAALVYFTGVVYFQTHFPFHTTFLGYDVSEREVSAVDECMAKESDARELTLIGLDGREETIPLSSAAAYQRSVTEPAEGWIVKEDAWYWPRTYFETNELSRAVSVSYDKEKLGAALDGLSFMDEENVIPPKDAYLEWQDGILVLIPEVDGNQLYRARTLQKMQAAVENDERELDLAAEGCYREPRVRSDDRELNRTLSRYEAINFQRIDIDMTGVTFTLMPDDVLDLYNIAAAKNRYSISEDAVADLVQTLKDSYDTYERSRPFVDHNGDEITVGTHADTYGFKMDYDATYDVLMAALESKETVTIEPVWINAGWARAENGSDIGDTYIEVSISGQHLWAYIDGEQVLSTDVVTGNAGNHDTPRGVFRILSMKQNAVLIGEDYETPVNYWMPLTWSGVGLHDATWRSNFGGSIYTYNGSHGCINLPMWAASELYGSYNSGTPVVVY